MKLASFRRDFVEKFDIGSIRSMDLVSSKPVNLQTQRKTPLLDLTNLQILNVHTLRLVLRLDQRFPSSLASGS